MKLKTVYLALVLIITLQMPFWGQSTKSFLNGFCIEAGGGQNNLFWSADFSFRTFIRTLGGVPLDRNDFKLVPTIRVSYQHEYYSAITIIPFVGYNMLGGYSKDDSYTLETVELGGLALYNVSNFSLGIGTKISYLLNAEYQYLDSDWNRSDWFTKQTADFGLRASYSIKPIILSVESWFGIFNLGNGILEKANIHQNHYRILLGYLF